MVEDVYRSTRGQSSGISWHYLCILAGVQHVKADLMIRRFVATAGQLRDVDPLQGRRAVLDAQALLEEKAPNLTTRHRIMPSGRPCVVDDVFNLPTPNVRRRVPERHVGVGRPRPSPRC